MPNPSLAPKFLTSEHRDLFFGEIIRLHPYQQSSAEYQAVLFIMTSQQELYQKMSPYFGTDGFKSLNMFQEQDFSGGYAKIAKAAANLFGQDYETSVADLAVSLDHDLFHTLLQAMIIRKYGMMQS